jgi:hypothetical protein
VLVAAGAATALVVSSLRDGGAPDGPDGSSELAQVQARVRTLLDRDAAATGPVREPGVPLDLGLDPWNAVVRGRTGGEAGGVAQPRRRQWERQDDDLTLSSDAIAAFERWQTEQRLQALQEQISAMRAREEGSEGGAATAPPTPVAAYLGRVRVTDAALSPYESIQVWPLVVHGAEPPPEGAPLTAEEALREELLVARETRTGSRVQLENRDPDRPVLVLAGDVLFGGRKDRVASSDVLLPPLRRVTIATRSSGEDRRRRTATFRSSGGLAPVHLRALVASNAVTSAWNDAVADTVSVLASPSRRGSLAQVFLNDVLMGDVERYVDQFTPRLEGESVVGLAVASGSTILGAEVFGDHDTFRALRARVLRSFLIEARLLQEGTLPGRGEIVALLEEARSGAHTAWSASGSRLASFRSADGSVFGSGILDGNRPVHAVLFKYAPRSSSSPWVAGRHMGLDPEGGRPDGMDRETGTDSGPTRGSGTGGPGFDSGK